jgi:septum formation protein
MSAAREQIILASASPRRRELLRGMGVNFEVVTARVSELNGVTAPHLAPADLARENARRKARAVAAMRPGRWVLGADTVVAAEEWVWNAEHTAGVPRNRIFGKPASIDEAQVFLTALSGSTHEVITACALQSPEGEVELMHDVSRVTMKTLTFKDIGRYLGTVNVLDKAGAYALQDRSEWIVEKVEGSRANVIGLPVEALEKILRPRGLL